MTEMEFDSNIEQLPDFDKSMFQEKYAVKTEVDGKLVSIEHEPSQMFRRVARRLAERYYDNPCFDLLANKDECISNKEEEFYQCMAKRKGLPAGRPMLAIGNDEANITAMNCFVVPIEDSVDGIYNAERDAAKIQQAGGGFGTNFSKLRPKGAYVKGVKSTASGPISFMKSFDAMIETMKSAGNRRGAGIAILDVTHPDILDFLVCKKNKELTNFNISVGITKEFIEALKVDGDIDLKHNGTVYKTVKAKDIFNKLVNNMYNYNEPGVFFKDKVNEMNNSWYYQKIEATNPCFAPGTKILTSDGDISIEELVGKNVKVYNGSEWVYCDNFRVTGENQHCFTFKLSNNSSITVTDKHTMIKVVDGLFEKCYAEDIKIGDKLRHIYGSDVKVVDICDAGIFEKVYCCTIDSNHEITLSNGIVLGNCGEIPLADWGVCCLGMLILPTFVKNPFASSEIDIDGLKTTVKTMVEMLDTVIDETKYPLKQNEKVSLQDRKIGLGITGLADMLAMLKIKYDSDEAIAIVDVLMQTIRNAAYEASAELAREKGSFPKFDKEKFLKGKFIDTLPDHIRSKISTFGIRNVSLLTCQPAGTVSLLLNNVSSGIEPIFSLKQKRTLRDENGHLTRKMDLYNYAYNYYRASGFNKVYGEKPDFFQTAKDVSLTGHIRMQNKVQQYVDSSISKTINFPESTSFESFEKFIYDVITGNHYIKGTTTFREGTIAAILTDADSTSTTFKPRQEEANKMDSFTYKIKRSSGKPSVHCTVAYEDNIKQIFMVTKDEEFYRQIAPIAILLSMVFSKEKDTSSIIEILQELESMNNFVSKEKFIYNKVEYNNILSALKECIWDALEDIGLISTDEDLDDEIEETEAFKPIVPALTSASVVCHSCGAKNSIVKEGKCGYCNVCGSPSGSCDL